MPSEQRKPLVLKQVHRYLFAFGQTRCARTVPPTLRWQRHTTRSLDRIHPNDQVDTAFQPRNDRTILRKNAPDRLSKKGGSGT